MIFGIHFARRARSSQSLARRLRTQAQSFDCVSQELDDPLVRSAGLATPRQVFLSSYPGKEWLTAHGTAREIPRRIRGRTRECEEGPLRRVRAA